MSAIEQAKQAMDNCNAGLDQIKAMIKSNQALVEDFNKRHTAWQSKRDTANSNWNNNNTTRQNSQRDWDTKRDNIYNDKGNDRKVTGGAGCQSHADWCTNDFGTGWTDDGDENHAWENGNCCCRHHRRCKKTDQQRKDEANQQTKDEMGERPGDYNEPHFSETEPQPPSQNLTNINMTCCANVQNIIGSSVSQSNLDQQNSCASQLKQNYADAKVADAKAQAQATTDTKTNSADAQVIATKPTDAQVIATEPATNLPVSLSKNAITLLIVGMVVFCSSSSAGLLLLLESS